MLLGKHTLSTPTLQRHEMQGPESKGRGSRFLLHLSGSLSCSAWTKEGTTPLVWKTFFISEALWKLLWIQHTEVQPYLDKPQDPCSQGWAHSLKHDRKLLGNFAKKEWSAFDWNCSWVGAWRLQFWTWIPLGGAESEGLACSCESRQWWEGICVLQSLCRSLCQGLCCPPQRHCGRQVCVSSVCLFQTDEKVRKWDLGTFPGCKWMGLSTLI